jgi:hypothetical protein
MGKQDGGGLPKLAFEAKKLKGNYFCFSSQKITLNGIRYLATLEDDDSVYLFHCHRKDA